MHELCPGGGGGAGSDGSGRAPDRAGFWAGSIHSTATGRVMFDDDSHLQQLNDYNEQMQSLQPQPRGNLMNINEAFPSNYLKASDLQGRKVIVEIDKVETAEFDEGREKKPCLYFKGKDKGLVLNKTNAMVIAAGYGPETDGWVGKEVALYTAKVPFQGQMTDALRVELPQAVADNESIPDF